MTTETASATAPTAEQVNPTQPTENQPPQKEKLTQKPNDDAEDLQAMLPYLKIPVRRLHVLVICGVETIFLLVCLIANVIYAASHVTSDLIFAVCFFQIILGLVFEFVLLYAVFRRSRRLVRFHTYVQAGAICVLLMNAVVALGLVYGPSTVFDLLAYGTINPGGIVFMAILSVLMAIVEMLFLFTLLPIARKRRGLKGAAVAPPCAAVSTDSFVVMNSQPVVKGVQNGATVIILDPEQKWLKSKSQDQLQDTLVKDAQPILPTEIAIYDTTPMDSVSSEDIHTVPLKVDTRTDSGNSSTGTTSDHKPPSPSPDYSPPHKRQPNTQIKQKRVFLNTDNLPEPYQPRDLVPYQARSLRRVKPSRYVPESRKSVYDWRDRPEPLTRFQERDFDRSPKALRLFQRRLSPVRHHERSTSDIGKSRKDHRLSYHPAGNTNMAISRYRNVFQSHEI